MPVEQEGDEQHPLHPYDPATVRATSSGPPPSSTAPGADQEPQSAADETAGMVVPFDRRYAVPFEGLVYLGALTTEFSWWGHHFVIRTLGKDDELAVPLVIKPWRGLLGEESAMATCMAGLCVVTVDGKELPIPLGGEDPLAWAHQRFEYAKANWFDVVINKIYNELLVLEGRSREVIEAMEKASAPMASTPTSNAISA